MANEKQPITIKKYANRRLYNTGSSAYVTLDDLGEMVKKGEDFVVFDAKSGDDITRSVLTQIIFEQEGKDGQNLLPIAFLRQLIRFYGDSMQMLVPSYLEFSIDKLTNEQAKFRDQYKPFATSPEQSRQIFQSLEEQTKKNMAMFNQALAVFNPFVANAASMTAPNPRSEAPAAKPTDLDDMKQQLLDMQKRLDSLSTKPE